MMAENILWMAVGLAVLGCVSCQQAAAPSGENDDWGAEREAMVRQLRAYGIRDSRVLDAMSAVRRHMYIPKSHRSRHSAYGDHPNPIGHGQTISQPFIVAYMTERIAPQPDEKVLEIGTGSGYQAAVLAHMGARIYSIEIVPELAEHAAQALKNEGFGDVAVLCGDGYKGWPEHAPFDAIIVTCAPESVPETLVEQLAEGGRMVVPVGVGVQRIVILRKREGKIEREDDLPVRFVPMVRGREE